VSNSNHWNTDIDAEGDTCNINYNNDNDGIPNAKDNCPLHLRKCTGLVQVQKGLVHAFFLDLY